MRFTDEQQLAIDARGTNLLLSAAAGSGKTTVLVERVLQLIMQDGAEVDRMLIVTFTRAAAADMRAKLIRSLSQAAADGDKRMSRQLRAIERASITTLHSFCSDFLRSNFEAAGIDPAFRVLDAAESDRLFAEALDEALEEAYRQGGEELKALDYGRGPDGVRAAAAALCACLRERPEPRKWLEKACCCEKAMPMWLDEIKHSTVLAINKAIMYCKMALTMPGCPAKYEAGLKEDIQGLMQIREVEDYDTMYREAAGFSFKKAMAKKGETDEDTLAEIKRLKEAAKSEIKKLAILELPTQQAMADAQKMCKDLAVLGALCLRAEELFDMRKAECSGMTYSDLEQKTLLALENEAVAAAVRERFDHVFVDEYQDTSDVQEALVSRIVRGNNLFMVGDVKQSIYRFRQAEPRLFLEKYHHYAKQNGGVLLALTRNFRSRETVINFVNLVFERLMQGGAAEIEYDALARLNVGSEQAQGGEPVEICLIDAADKDEEREDAAAEEIHELETAEREGLLIAQRIRELMEQDNTLHYRDIAVLTRTGKTSFTPIMPMLLAAGIPAYADGSTGYYDSVEVMLALALLQLVVNERSDRELIGVLRCGICGLTTEELAQIRIRLPRAAYVDAARLVAEDETPTAARLRWLFELLASLRLRMGSMDLGDLVRAAIGESGLYLYVGALPGGKQRQANLDMLVDSAANYERNISGSLARFLKYARNLKERGDGDSAHLLGENDDVVRLMTVHKSKGLEFRVVFGAMLHKKIHSADTTQPILMHGRMGVGMAVYDPQLRTKRKTLPWAAIAQLEKREETAEEMRILYVLLTRAKERLILTGTVRNLPRAMRRWECIGAEFSAAGSQLDMVMGAVLAAEREGMAADIVQRTYRADSFIAPAAAAPADDSLQLFDEAVANPNLYADTELVQSMAWQYPDENAARRPMKLTVTGLLRELEGPEEIAALAERPAFMSATQGMTGAERGSAYHRAMQLLKFEGLCALEGNGLVRRVRAQLDAMEEAHLLEEAQRRAVYPNNLALFLESGLGKRLLAAAEVKREWPFNVILQAKDVLELGEGATTDGDLIVQGVIDCCFVENGKWILLDYKTDRADDPETLLEKYRRQLDIYAIALQRITGMPVHEKWLCLLGAGQQLRL